MNHYEQGMSQPSLKALQEKRAEVFEKAKNGEPTVEELQEKRAEVFEQVKNGEATVEVLSKLDQQILDLSSSEEPEKEAA